MAIATINPATGELLQTFQPLSDAQIEQKLQRAVTTFHAERKTPFAERARRMLKAAAILERDKEKFAHLMTLEMGKPYKAAVAEAVKCTTACRYYAENAEQILTDEIIETGAKKSFIRYRPIGPILAVMPWNFPFWQVIRFAAPALMAGNVGLLKHASNVPQCALAIEKIFLEAGFPAGAFQTLLIGSQPIEHSGALRDRSGHRSHGREQQRTGGSLFVRSAGRCAGNFRGRRRRAGGGGQRPSREFVGILYHWPRRCDAGGGHRGSSGERYPGERAAGPAAATLLDGGRGTGYALLRRDSVRAGGRTPD